ncbi:MAG: RdgB/HAM1 family non-canonical purine NTP pyrophosphatase [Bacteroidales bacterium]|nr:RdgB/HAM1 family non-canonical purine NTP pyrophosphatase [Bacteroidales bacterium]MCI2146326.1 RdgB/HAM1 family non-canonical purine NTP pyrophosphatase [Bacteroidales bacterium]
MHIVFATGNRNKLIEAEEILGPSYCLVTPAGLGFHGDIPETGTTIKENAIQKAAFVYGKFGKCCFADDTGLEIDALGGAPGVYSARYSGPAKDPKENIRKVLKELDGVPEDRRTARFRCVMALVVPSADGTASTTHTFEGVCEGRIISEEEGREGFGYDPIFVPEGYGRTFAELTPGEKNAISHRGRALRALAQFLQTSHEPIEPI